MMQALTLAGMLGVSANAMSAQVCMGRHDLTGASSNISTTVAAAGSQRMVLGRYGVGGRRVFGGVHASYASYALKDPRPIAAGVHAGVAISLGASGATQLCPFAQSTYFGKLFDSQGLTTSLGLSLGRAMPVTSSLAIAPFVQTGVLNRPFRYLGYSITPGDVERFRVARSQGLFSGQAGVGLGLRFGELLTVNPSAMSQYATETIPDTEKRRTRSARRSGCGDSDRQSAFQVSTGRPSQW